MHIRKIEEIRKFKKLLEKKLNLSIDIIDRNVNFEGPSLDEYEASIVFDAMNFGFSLRKALLLKGDDVTFRVIHIKEHTKRNLKEIMSRLIGTNGKTRKVMENISGCKILIKEGNVGVLGYVEDVENLSTAIIHLIRGSKQSNMYQYLERRNREKKNYTDLGLKHSKPTFGKEN